MTPSARQRVGRQVLWHPPSHRGTPPSHLISRSPFLLPSLPLPPLPTQTRTLLIWPIAAHESPLRTPRPLLLLSHIPTVLSLCYFAKPEIALSLSHPRYQSSLNSLCKTEPTICLAADLQKLELNANKAADLNVCDINL